MLKTGLYMIKEKRRKRNKISKQLIQSRTHTGAAFDFAWSLYELIYFQPTNADNLHFRTFTELIYVAEFSIVSERM